MILSFTLLELNLSYLGVIFEYNQVTQTMSILPLPLTLNTCENLNTIQKVRNSISGLLHSGRSWCLLCYCSSFLAKELVIIFNLYEIFEWQEDFCLPISHLILFRKQWNNNPSILNSLSISVLKTEFQH